MGIFQVLNTLFPIKVIFMPELYVGGNIEVTSMIPVICTMLRAQVHTSIMHVIILILSLTPIL